MSAAPPPGSQSPDAPVDPRPALEALVARGRAIQARAAELAVILGRRGPDDAGFDPTAVVAELDDRFLLTGFRFREGWRDGRDPAELASLFDLSLLAVSPVLPPLPRVDPARLASVDFSGGPVTATDLSGAFSAVAAYGAVMHFRLDLAALAAAKDETLGEIIADVGRRAALESDLLGRYAPPEERR